MNFLFRLSYVAVGLLLAGCFDNPLTSSPSEKIDVRLFGIWEHVEKDGQSSRRAIISPIDSDRCAIDIVSIRNGRQEPLYKLEGWISRVGGVNFLTLRCLRLPIKTIRGGYRFVNFQFLNRDNLRIQLLSLKMEEESLSSYELREQIRRRLKNDSLYIGEPLNCKRIAGISCGH